ncbi:hypothetical protein Bca52824_076789 [Brassica carinata]|uniref:Uncharacterized protein n=1 Tax=Brassica carinata TaxID=52824 RepID=A0A8X7PTQ9_BRACI|nr:hypothetical protein Bca52824_076789 [Brassica carinata]
MDLKPPLGNVISDSTHPNVTPDPRWPSKCRWSIESPPPAISTGTVSTAEKSNAGSELSSPLAVNVDNEVMRHQIDVMVLESNPVVSSETPYLKQLGESDSVADPELVAAGDNTSSDITSQPENEEAGLVVVNGNQKSIDLENPVLEVVHLATEAANAQQSSSKDSEEKVRNSVSRVHDSVSNKVSVGLVIPENEEPWLTIPQSSPSGCRNNGKSARSTEVELPSTSSPSRFHLLSTDLEEGEVEMENESPSSDEESSVESKAAFEKKKQMEKQKLGKNK